MREFLKKPGTVFAVYVLFLCIGLFSTLYTFLNAFSFPNMGLILGVVLCSGVLFSFLFRMRNKAWKRNLTIIFLVIWLLGGVLLWKPLSGGAVIFTEQFMSDLARIFSVSLGEFALMTPQNILRCTLFALYILIPYAYFVAWLVVSRKSRWLSLLATASLFGFTYALNDLPAQWLFGMQLIFWASMLLQPGKAVKKEKAGAGLPLMGLTASTLVFAIVLTVVPAKGYEAGNGTYAIRDEIVAIAGNIGAFRWIRSLAGVTGGAPLTSSDGYVNLNAAGRMRYADREIMKVTAEVPQTFYMRGFSASVYTGSAWEQDEDSFDLNFEEIGITPLHYLSNQGRFYFESSPVPLTVEMNRSGSNFLFTPYGLAGTVNADPMPNWERDAYLPASRQSEYSLTYFPESILISGRRQTAIGSLAMNFTGGIDSVNINGYQYSNSYTDSGYMKYIADHYTQLPDGMRGRLIAWLEADIQTDYSAVIEQGTVPYWNWAYIAEFVSESVRNIGNYNASVGNQPRGEDFVEYFLYEGREGFCVHYASATVLLLRALGIPARYVEGYLVSESSFNADRVASVPGESAHAWAEIWVPNFGWVPVESTPGGVATQSGASEAPTMDPDRVQQNPNTPTTEPNQNETPNEVPETPNQPDKEETETSTFRRAILYADAVIILFVFLPLGTRYIMRLRRKRKFGQPDFNAAAVQMYAYLNRLSVYGIGISPEVEDVAMKAKFSQHKIGKSELSVFHDTIKAAKSDLKANLPFWKRCFLWIIGVL